MIERLLSYLLKQFVLFDGESGVNYINWFYEKVDDQVSSQLITAFLMSLIHFTEDVFHGRLQNLEIEGGKLVLTGKTIQIKDKSRLILIGALVDQEDDDYLVNNVITDLMAILEKYLTSSNSAIIESEEINTQIRSYLKDKEKIISIKDKVIYGALIALFHIFITVIASIDYHNQFVTIIHDFLTIIVPVVIAITVQTYLMEELGGLKWGKRTIIISGIISISLAYYLVENIWKYSSNYITGFGTPTVYFVVCIFLFWVPAVLSSERVAKKFFVRDIKIFNF